MLIIFLIIRFEFSFDTYHVDPENIYGFVHSANKFGEIKFSPGVPYPAPRAIKNDFPQIEYLTIVDCNFSPSVIAVTQKDGTISRFKEEKGIAYVNSDYFKILTNDWLRCEFEDDLYRIANPERK